jgi:membrane peptidoglycan carboxypeptidase
MQMVSSFGTLANDGIRLAPHLVREVRASRGTVLYRASSEARRVIKTETAQEMRSMFERMSLPGTARHGLLDFYTAAGKAGVAMKVDPKTHAYSKTKYVSSFVGFAPVENPALVIIVVIDEPAVDYRRRESVSEAAFREIAEEALPELSVEPEVRSNTAELISPTLDMAGTSLLAQENAHKLTEPREAIRSQRQAQHGERREKNKIMMSVVSNRARVTGDLNESVVQESIGRAPPYMIQGCAYERSQTSSRRYKRPSGFNL